MQKPLWIVANWKSNKSPQDCVDWLNQVGRNLPKEENLKVVVCPMFSSLYEAYKLINNNSFPLMLGAQDISANGIGAFTGEEPAKILAKIIQVSIVGHSERRNFLSESDELIAKKVEQAVMENILPILCVQDENTPIPENVSIIAYEPIFAIGTGIPDTPENANLVAEKIRVKLNREVKILYGGSVNSSNIRTFVEQQNIDGALIGSASLDPQEFINIVQACI